ncbi:sulfatase [Blastopirellula sp. JC732]|uniref:Sulfatase n=1 Tax=Blastopirellula sediminis TaxID=2894196 RepID=A0A9X1MSX9_9BACT|nr:sulfatase [Blastopirellula sediminis]MCC9604697.1 sulfatase [Blastopirellula sediminis]MCC9632004.1 sulfatase [Blastopirellula sediminis]
MRRFALGLVLVLSTVATAFAKEDRPNFLVILCDDLGYGDLGCYGNQTIQTPNLNVLAKQGMRLTACYSSAPVCSSSRAGLMTGRTPSRIGVYDWIPAGNVMHVRQSEKTVASLLQDAGYDTCHVGKWHLNGKFNSDQQPQPGDQGFNHWFSTQNNAAPTHENPNNFVRNGKAVGEQQGYSCQVVADEAIQWLKTGRDADKPFFAFVCFHEPHEPIASPDELVTHYGDAKKKGEALYYANVENMDRAVGRLMKAVDELKLTDNTFVFFTSDNGPETLDRYPSAWRSHGSPGPLRGMKLHIYEGGIRVPDIVRFPGHIKPGAESDEPICGLDILPTLCELAGVAAPTDRALDGASFAKSLQGEKVDRPAPLFWHYYNAIGPAKVAMRVGDWKLVAHVDLGTKKAGGNFRPELSQAIKQAKLSTLELYNLNDDLAEKHDLAAEKPELVARMKKQLQAKYDAVLTEAPDWEAISK